jgi:hypothetical protein
MAAAADAAAAAAAATAAGLKGLCAEAKVVMQRVAALNDLVIVSRDGDEFAASKAMLAAVSVMLG